MGYTHYYQQHEPISTESWTQLSKNVTQLIEHAWDTALDVEMTNQFMIINGVGEQAHEEFAIFRNDTRWEFCKTNRKDYDKVVTAVLILMRYTYPSFSVSSDGDWDDWIEGRELFTEVFYLEPSSESVFGNANHIYPAVTLS
jgi:hypothetical protein